MKITIRLISSIAITIILVACAFTFFQARHDKRQLLSELDRRALVISESLQETVEPLLTAGNEQALSRLAERFGNRDRLIGVLIYDPAGHLVAMTKSLSETMSQLPPQIQSAIDGRMPVSAYFPSGPNQDRHFYAIPLGTPENNIGSLVLVHRANHVRAQVAAIWRQDFFRFLVQAFLISLITLFIVRWNILSPILKAAEWIKELRTGVRSHLDVPLPKDIFGPLEREVTRLATSFVSARAAAEEEAKLRQQAESIWTPDRLREFARTIVPGQKLLVVSNREPYMHVRTGKDVNCIMPASGLVTALEPILRACGGTWVAHGSGDADRQMTDAADRVRVPPEDPQYTLRRVWLSKEEEDGYYYGFANEGFWPLCHIAHNRPVFKPEDWNYYQSVNQKFADAVLEEIASDEDPLILIQDYHFALLPRMIKEKRPDARVALFWHIPWPNPESFGICPWQKEIIHGMLGADLIGFHIQFHCNNFLDTVDRTLECRIDWERFVVNRQEHKTLVKPLPISVALTPSSANNVARANPLADKEALLKQNAVKGQYLAVGVDRIDYTKGIIERFRGIERFLEKNPEYQGRFVFVELGAPSRTLIKRYHDLMAEVEEEAERINWKFKTKEWQPILFLKKHHSHKDIEPYYKAADICLVTSLHDGMNLVAKEYIASRDDEDGVLILSRFAGASRELPDALIINPYDIDKTAAAIRVALEMSAEERKNRMRRMRAVVMSNNIYKWGANLIENLSQIRLEAVPRPAPL